MKEFLKEYAYITFYVYGEISNTKRNYTHLISNVTFEKLYVVGKTYLCELMRIEIQYTQ